MLNREVLQEGAYLYSVWSGQLRVYKGSVIKIKEFGGLNPIFEKDDPARVIFSGEYKGLQCIEQPEVVYNAMVWLRERDDERAKEILINNEKIEILKLKEKIDNHLNKIEIIERGIIK